ncbi:hypothetical protein E2562_027256 [Oryza meyeriana var. granulata]|uniref:Uncharacterized protein n=1 Tax=Oryza meyeriana var. granulata TaxID=110450 RepID=A0A6G1C971_9ORYZ|nr:hypothetical protein E2562_027256 [Oryza meyeriana var. granulata]
MAEKTTPAVVVARRSEQAGGAAPGVGTGSWPDGDRTSVTQLTYAEGVVVPRGCSPAVAAVVPRRTAAGCSTMAVRRVCCSPAVRGSCW